jgi:chorismate synthase
MSHNTFGHMFQVMTWGESHGPSLGCVVDGCPPGILLTAEDIQGYLDQRRPGQSKFVSQRKEPDTVQILSGVFEDDNTDGPRTTGTPISLLIQNEDQRSKDYSQIKDRFRPGHADFTYLKKYGLRDYRGGGRSSARETAARVAAGAIARKILTHILGSDVTIQGGVVQMGPHRIDRSRIDWSSTGANPFWCPDPGSVSQWEEYLDGLRKAGSSCGAVVEVIAKGIPVGLGSPIYGKLDAELAAALMSINAVKGVEIGDGFATASLTGEENADEMRRGDNGPVFLSNHSGGILGGISSGQDVVARFAVKPTSSILTPRRTVTIDGQDEEIVTKGRHDPCVGIRAVPVGEAMMACVLADQLLRHRGQIGLTDQG